MPCINVDSSDSDGDYDVLMATSTADTGTSAASGGVNDNDGDREGGGGLRGSKRKVVDADLEGVNALLQEKMNVKPMVYYKFISRMQRTTNTASISHNQLRV